MIAVMSNENGDLVCVVCVLQRDDVLVSSTIRIVATPGNPNACLDVAAAPLSTQKKQETFNAIHLQVSQINTSSSNLCSSELRPLLERGGHSAELFLAPLLFQLR